MSRIRRYRSTGVGAPIRTNPSASAGEFGDLSIDASFTSFIPALDFDPNSSSAVSDTHRDSAEEKSWVTRDGSNMTRNRAIAT